jgi:hypothetical protein
VIAHTRTSELLTRSLPPACCAAYPARSAGQRTQNIQIGAPAWRDVEIALAAQIGGEVRVLPDLTYHSA